jgi:thymidylate kinase
MSGKLVVITGLDGSGTSTLADLLSKVDPHGEVFHTPHGPFGEVREKFDDSVRSESPAAHFLFYLASVVHASSLLAEKLKTRNVYCTRYLIDTVVSHRAAGLDVQLDYETASYSIRRPDVTLFVHADEATRQRRLAVRSKTNLDKALDENETRERFLTEFRRLADEYEVINNTVDDPSHAVAEAIRFLPWARRTQ